MAISFPKTPINNPLLAGGLAAPKQFFGEFNRFAVAPVNTRFDAVEWFVWDADAIDPVTGAASVIRQAATLEEALAGLPIEAYAPRKQRITVSPNTGRYILQEWNPHYKYWATTKIYRDEEEGYQMAQIYKLNKPFWA